MGLHLDLHRDPDLDPDGDSDLDPDGDCHWSSTDMEGLDGFA